VAAVRLHSKGFDQLRSIVIAILDILGNDTFAILRNAPADRYSEIKQANAFGRFFRETVV
jgi:hypothetical protein